MRENEYASGLDLKLRNEEKSIPALLSMDNTATVFLGNHVFAQSNYPSHTVVDLISEKETSIACLPSRKSPYRAGFECY
jgi:hypothetical protein